MGRNGVTRSKLVPGEGVVKHFGLELTGEDNQVMVDFLHGLWVVG